MPSTEYNDDAFWNELAQGGVWLRARGHSMRPFYPDGTRLCVEPVAMEHLRAGDLVLLRAADGPVLHRLLRREAEGLVTKGDARRHADARWPDDAYRGRVTAVWTRRGVVPFERTWAGRAAPLLARGSGLAARVLLALGLVVSLAACGSSSSGEAPTWRAMPALGPRQVCTIVQADSRYEPCCYTVNLTPYHLTSHEITVREAGKGASDAALTGVGWAEAEAICTRLGGRLPTDAEWALAWGLSREAPQDTDSDSDSESDSEDSDSEMAVTRLDETSTPTLGLLKVNAALEEWTLDALHTQCRAGKNGEAWAGDTSGHLYRRSTGDMTNLGADIAGAATRGFRCRREAAAPKVANNALTWLAIPGGVFRMGCDADDVGCGAEAQPSRLVTVAPFALAATETTQAQYVAFMGALPKGQTATCQACPIALLDFAEAEAFCRAAGGRLPSEAEWEYAARGGSARNYLFDNPATNSAFEWTRENAGGILHPVAALYGNGFGLADMLGNVREWTADRWHADFTGAPLTSITWTTGPSEQRVVRGGAYPFARALWTSHSHRSAVPETLRDSTLGVRCAR